MLHWRCQYTEGRLPVAAETRRRGSCSTLPCIPAMAWTDSIAQTQGRWPGTESVAGDRVVLVPGSYRYALKAVKAYGVTTATV